MTDPGTALAITSLVIDVGCIVLKFISDWKGAPESALEFARELGLLNGNLARTEAILQSSEYKAAFNIQPDDVGISHGSDDQQIVESLKYYQIQLQVLQDELPNKHSTFFQKQIFRFHSAINSEKLTKSMARVNRCCSQIQQRISIDTSLLTAQMTNTVNTLLKSHQELKSWHTDEKNIKILAWTSSISFQQMQEDILSKRHEATGTWLLECDKFLNWRNDNDLSSALDSPAEHRVPATLLAYGLPGAGKSVMAAIVIDHLQKSFDHDKQIAVAYTYCSRSLEGRTCLDFIANLTRQIAQQHAELPQILREEYRKHTNGAGGMSLSSYMLILSKMIMSFRRTYIVFDALDEYESTKYGQESRSITDIAESIQQILLSCGSKCRLFLTSRNNTLRQFQTVEHLSIEIKATPEDIKSYVEGRIADPTRFKHSNYINNNPSLRTKIVDTLVSKAEGQFLLTRLHLNSLDAQVDARRLKERLLNLSVNLREIYFDTMLRIRAQSDEDQELAYKVIGWTSHATRPLSLKEIQHGLAVEDGDKNFDIDGIVPEDRFIIACAGLVEIQSTEVKLVHPSVKEYLDATPEEEWYHKVDEGMALRSLAYLSLADFTSPCTPFEFEQRLKEYPFLKYAAHNFGVHASRCHNAKSVVHQKCREFLCPDTLTLGSLQAIATKVLTVISPQRIMCLDYPALHMAVLCGLEQIVNDMLEKNTDIETIGHKLETPLHMAVRTSSPAMVSLLLEKGAKVNATNWSSKSALDMVMCQPYQTWLIHTGRMDLADRIEIFKPLIVHTFAKKWKADIDSGKPLQDIAISLDISYLDSLIAGLAEKAWNDGNRDDAEGSLIDRILGAKLALDISDDDEEVVKLLVHHHIDVNSQLFADLTALQFAALYERTSLIRFLLDHGANPFLKREAGYTALDIAEKRGNDKAAEFLRLSMTQLEKQEVEITDEAGKLVIPGPKQAREYDARSKSVESRSTRQKKMEDYKTEAAKLDFERFQERIFKNDSVIIHLKGVLNLKCRPPDDQGAEDSMKMETTKDSQLRTESSTETLEVPTLLHERSSTTSIEDQTEFPNGVEDTPNQPSSDVQARAALRSAIDTPVPPEPQTPIRTPNSQSSLALQPRLNTMHSEDTDPRVLWLTAPGTPDVTLTPTPGESSSLGKPDNLELGDVDRV